MKPPAGALRELAVLFLRLGVTAFGGPAAHIAMMQDEVVRRRNWLTQAELLDLIGITQLIPGPNSTELAIHIGQRRAGWRGLLVAGAAFIVPAALLTGVLAWVYVRFGALPEASAVLYGIKPVLIAVLAQAVLGLTPNALKQTSLRWIGGAALIASAAGVNELLCLVLAGLAELLTRQRTAARLPPLAVTPFGLGALGWVFVKIGSVLFGSGYVLLAFLRTELVENRHWLTEAQLLDAIAVGQLTPGPVFTSATFIGYVLGGVPGAAVATLGIFAPAFFFVALSSALLPRMRRSRALSALLDGVNVASLALMAVVTVRLARSALVDVPTLALASASTFALLRWRVSSTWLIAGGALVGLAVHRFR